MNRLDGLDELKGGGGLKELGGKFVLIGDGREAGVPGVWAGNGAGPLNSLGEPNGRETEGGAVFEAGNGAGPLGEVELPSTGDVCIGALLLGDIREQREVVTYNKLGSILISPPDCGTLGFERLFAGLEMFTLDVEYSPEESTLELL